MSDELEEIQADVQPSQVLNDEAFCARMRTAIEAGLENAPIGAIYSSRLGLARPALNGRWGRKVNAGMSSLWSDNLADAV